MNMPYISIFIYLYIDKCIAVYDRTIHYIIYIMIFYINSILYDGILFNYRLKYKKINIC